MTTVSNRVDLIAGELYEQAGAFVSCNQLRSFLGCGRNTATTVLSKLTPAFSIGYPRYYYRDIAELLAKGDG